MVEESLKNDIWICSQYSAWWWPNTYRSNIWCLQKNYSIREDKKMISQKKESYLEKKTSLIPVLHGILYLIPVLHGILMLVLHLCIFYYVVPSNLATLDVPGHWALVSQWPCKENQETVSLWRNIMPVWMCTYMWAVGDILVLHQRPLLLTLDMRGPN